MSNVCNLCDSEKFHILFHPELSDLNSKSEFYSHCRHIKSKLLVKKQKRRKKGHGWTLVPWEYFLIPHYAIFLFCLFSYSSKPEESRPLLETLSSLIKEWLIKTLLMLDCPSYYFNFILIYSFYFILFCFILFHSHLTSIWLNHPFYFFILFHFVYSLSYFFSFSSCLPPNNRIIHLSYLFIMNWSIRTNRK